MRDTITCPVCGGNLKREDDYLCDCCGHRLGDNTHPQDAVDRIRSRCDAEGMRPMSTVESLEFDRCLERLRDLY